MKFSIRRPKLPSSETHPEESMYRRLDVSAWLRHLNELGQVEEEYKLRKVRPPAGWSRARGRGHLRGAGAGLVPSLAERARAAIPTAFAFAGCGRPASARLEERAVKCSPSQPAD